MTTMSQYQDLAEALTPLINGLSLENGSNTPDFVLSEFLTVVTKAFDDAINRRAEWYGRMDRPGQRAQRRRPWVVGDVGQMTNGDGTEIHYVKVTAIHDDGVLGGVRLMIQLPEGTHALVPEQAVRQGNKLVPS